jgi:outer membrane receptor protein involved in Fe transport
MLDIYNPYTDVYATDYHYRFTDHQLNDLRPPAESRAQNNLDLNIYSGKIDFEKKLTTSLSLETGVKQANQDIYSNYIFENLDPLSGTYQSDPRFSNHFLYHEEISAAYVSLDKSLKKYSVQAGLRAENTIVRTRSELAEFAYRRDYFKLFPNLSVNYHPNDQNSYSLSYQRRIWRPDYNSFNPYYTFNNLFSISRGNPYLMPEFDHNIELMHVYKSKITNSFYYFRAQTPIRGQTVLDDSSKVTFFQMGNLKSSNEARYALFVTSDPTKWWNLSLNLGVFYYDFKGTIDGRDLNTSAFSYFVSGNNTFLLPRNFKFEVGGYFVGPWLYGGFYKIRPRGALNLGIKKKMFREKLNVTLSIQDIFFTASNHNFVNFQNQNMEIFETYDSRRVAINVSYSFGKIKIDRRNVEGDEKGRMGK